MTLNEVADLISSPMSELLVTGNYVNRPGVRGYYAQFKCGEHWCKVSVSHAEQHSARISHAELEDISWSALSPAVAIPHVAIAAALKSPEAEEAAVRPYLNASSVQGSWAEFRFQGNWYMISVSRVDEPALADRDELERVTDEFLWQQGQVHPRRRR